MSSGGSGKCLTCNVSISSAGPFCDECNNLSKDLNFRLGEHNKITRYDNPILNERESSHGDYSNTALIAQDLKSIVRGHSERLNNTQAESLDLICTKIARLLSGDPNCKDTWDDIAGYANLVGERLSASD